MTMIENNNERVEYELMEIANIVTAMGDMIKRLFIDFDELETDTPKGVKILLIDIRKRIDDLRKYISGKKD